MNNKKNTIITIIAIVSLLIMLVSATYAFFQAQGGDTVTRNVNVLTHTVDTLSFSVSNDISIEADQFNFTRGGNNLSSEATATAVLTPNSKTGTATDNYFVYLDITDNEFEYSAANIHDKPELLLQVFTPSPEHWCIVESSESTGEHYELCLVDPTQNDIVNIINNGNEYIETEEDCQYYLGLLEDYLESQSVEFWGTITCEQRNEIQLELNDREINYNYYGYDITEETGIIKILDGHEISASNNQTTIETYRVVITLINHNFNQNDISGKSFNANIIVRKSYTGAIYSRGMFYNGLNIIDTEIDACYEVDDETGDTRYTKPYNESDYEFGNECDHEIIEIGIEPSSFSNPNFNSNHEYPTYLKYNVVNNIVDSTEVCLWLNNHELCLEKDYWDTDYETTLAKLKADMETTFGVTIYDSYEEAQAANSSSYCDWNSCQISDQDFNVDADFAYSDFSVGTNYVSLYRDGYSPCYIEKYGQYVKSQCGW